MSPARPLKLLFVFGTRPEAIKLAPLILEARSRPGITVRLCTTGQHRQLLDQVLPAFSLQPDIDLDLMQPAQDLSDVTTRCLLALRPVMQSEKPDWVIVQGDTTTTFAASLASYYDNRRVAHIEAGLRTYQKRSPFPEEINRRLTTHLSDLHFAPTERSRRALLAEGVEENAIHVCGNTVVDALLETRRRYEGSWPEIPGLRPIPKDRKVILVTGHRRESFGDGFRNICRALAEVVHRRSDVEVVYPVHLNPSVQGPVFETLAGCARIQLLEPLPYVPFVHLMTKAHLILTDSGGIQEEAPSLGKPVLVMRDVTERPEAIEAGTARLVGTQVDAIVDGVASLLDGRAEYERMSRAQNPYGDGRASARIVEVLMRSANPA